MNIKKFQIDGITNQIQALEYANKMMSTNWGIYANEPAFQFCDMEFTKKLVGKDYVCPFSSPNKWNDKTCFTRSLYCDERRDDKRAKTSTEGDSIWPGKLIQNLIILILSMIKIKI